MPQVSNNPTQKAQLSRARGCLIGQLAGDALGSLVEFKSIEEIRESYPNGVRELTDGGAFNTIAGQPTDDSEMALMLARTLIDRGAFDCESIFLAYRFWLDSKPFDLGRTVASGLRGHPNFESQANGAMMRISPLGIFGVGFTQDLIAEWAELDAGLTHPNKQCQHANALFVTAIAQAIGTGCKPQELYLSIQNRVREISSDPALRKSVFEAKISPPADFSHHKGHVLIAFQNALWQLLNAPTFEEGIVDTISRGGDTDTNAAICGALLGAVYGLEAIPAQWTEKILSCRPQAGKPGVHQPRPEFFWPVDALELAEKLLNIKS
ncbi:MAG: ADP-ribosylglycohydrolase family protein [Deltaproteobacteria bacterium]|jgi:ADP-ribosylglycohydrolase|nr:ADP-ribosylglycohydrolase family protein [Deltaproteobacteria bacterium]